MLEAQNTVVVKRCWHGVTCRVLIVSDNQAEVAALAVSNVPSFSASALAEQKVKRNIC